MSTTTHYFTKTACVFTLILVALPFSAIRAAPINYGDFVGSSVMYLDVTETANTPDDTTPLLSNPGLIGNMLDFNPRGFAASAGGGSTDLTDAQLNFTLSGLSGSAITDILFSEAGDYNLFGSGTAITSLFHALSISSVVVLEVDGVTMESPIFLPGASASGSDNLSGGNELGSLWNLSLDYDVNAGLTSAGVLFDAGATRLDIVLDNTLGAISEFSSLAMIAKKDFRIDVATQVSAVPIPASILLFGSGLLGLAGMARRKSAN